METETLYVVTEHNARWAAADLDGLFALYHPDMVFTDHYTGHRYVGEALRTHVTAVIKRSKLDSLTYTDRVRIDGDTATLRYREAIRSASGDALLTVTACDVVRVEHGLIVAIDEYAIPEQGTAPVQVRRPANKRAQEVGNRMEKIGLSAREIGYLLADLDAWMQTARPFCDAALSLQQVAAATGYTRNQISFALNQVKGVSFFDYLNRIRVEYLLQAVPMPVEGGVVAWAEQAGFRSTSTFYGAFRVVTGMSPAAWLTTRAVNTD